MSAKIHRPDEFNFNLLRAHARNITRGLNDNTRRGKEADEL